MSGPAISSALHPASNWPVMSSHRSRVPFRYHAPDILPSMLSASGHWLQSGATPISTDDRFKPRRAKRLSMLDLMAVRSNETVLRYT